MADARLPPVPRPAVPDGVDPAFACSVRFWSRAYPRRWRVARGAELLGLLADLSAPGARRLGVRSAFDLVRSGWATRLRERPPPGAWLRYRLLGNRAMRDHLGWVTDDIAGALFPLRGALPPLALVFVTDLTLVAGGMGSLLLDSWWTWAVLTLAVVADTLSGDTRRRAIETHLVTRPGEQVANGSWVRLHAPRPRVTARSALPWAAVATSALLVVCVVALFQAHHTLSFTWHEVGGPSLRAWVGGEVPRGTLLGILAVAVGAGVFLGVLVPRRLRGTGLEVDQPDRVLVDLGPRRAGLVVLGVGVLTALSVAESFGAVALATSLPLGIAAALLAPPAVVAWWALRRAPDAGHLAFADVCRIGLRGRPPVADPPGVTLVPALPSEVGEIWPRPWGQQGSTPALG